MGSFFDAFRQCYLAIRNERSLIMKFRKRCKVRTQEITKQTCLTRRSTGLPINPAPGDLWRCKGVKSTLVSC